MYKNLQFMIIPQSRRTPALLITALNTTSSAITLIFGIIHLLFPYVIDVCGLIADYSPAYCFKSIIFTTITTLSIIDKKVSIVLSSPCQSYQHLDFFLRQIYATQEFQHLFHLLVLIICQSIHFYSPVSFDCTRVKCQIICYRLDIMSKR